MCKSENKNENKIYLHLLKLWLTIKLQLNKKESNTIRKYKQKFKLPKTLHYIKLKKGLSK